MRTSKGKITFVSLFLILFTVNFSEAQHRNYLGTPEEFTDADRQRLTALQQRHTELVDLYMYNVRGEAERAQMLAEMKNLVQHEMPTLETRKENWEQFYGLHTRWGPSQFPNPELLGMIRQVEQALGSSDSSTRTGQQFEKYVHQLSLCDNSLQALIDKPNAPAFFLRRFMLLKARCYLHASVAYYKSGNPRMSRDQLRTYRAGVRLLESLLLVDASLTARVQDDVSLSDPRYQWWEPLDPNLNPDWYRVLELQEARELLASYCPWGRTVFNFLYEAGIVPFLDFRILEPYQKEYGLFDQVKGILGYLDIVPPMIQIVELAPDQPPAHIADEMNAAVGDRRIGHIIRGGVAEPHLWEWACEHPVSRMWVISPMVNNLSFADRVKWAIMAVKLFFAGPLTLGVDTTVDYLYAWYGELVEEEGGIFVAMGLVVDGNNAGIDSGYLLGSSQVKYWADPNRRNEFNANKLFNTMLTKWAEAQSEWEQQCIFDWLDPHATGIPSGVSYDGSMIPPIVIQSDVFGFDQRPADRYRGTRRVARFFQLDLRVLSGKATYDLSQSVSPPLVNAARYGSGDQNVIRHVWPVLPNNWQKRKFLGRREYVMDFTPRTQVIKLQFCPELHEYLTTDQQANAVNSTVSLFIPICHEGSQTRIQIGEWPLQGSEFVLQLFDRSLDPTGIFPDRLLALRKLLRSIDARNMSSQAAAAMVNQVNAPEALTQTMVPVFGNLTGSATCDLHTQYEVVVKRGGQAMDPFPLRFKSRPESGGNLLRRTGKITNVQDPAGMVVMEYNIEGEVNLDAVIPPPTLPEPEPEVRGMRFESPRCLTDGSVTYEDGDSLTEIKVKAQLPPGTHEIIVKVGNREYHFYGYREAYNDASDQKRQWVSFSGYAALPLGQRLQVQASLRGSTAAGVRANIVRQLSQSMVGNRQQDLDKALRAVAERREKIRRDMADPEWGTDEMSQRLLAQDLRRAADAFLKIGRVDEAVMMIKEACGLAQKTMAKDVRQLAQIYFKAADILYVAGDLRGAAELIGAGCSALEGRGDQVDQQSSSRTDEYYRDAEVRYIKLADYLLVSGHLQDAMNSFERSKQLFQKRRSPDKRRPTTPHNLRVFTSPH